MVKAPHRGSTSAVVLVADDLAATRCVYADHLRKAGYAVIEAATGAEAIAHARRTRPDVIVLDLSLPDFDASDTVRILRSDALTRTVPVVAVSAHPLDGDEAEARAAGCNAYVARASQRHHLVATVSRTLGAARERTRFEARLRASSR